MMNQIKYTFIVGLLACMTLTACSEDDIIPSDDNHLIAFPQGTNTYDTEIMQLYTQYGTQILYRYNDAMFRWQITGQLDYVSQPADEQYVSDALTFIRQNCLRYYNPDSLRLYLPYRIYLASNLGRLFNYSGLDATGRSVTVSDTVWHTAAVNGYANMCFGLACSRLTTMSQDSLRLAKGELNAALLAHAIDEGHIAVPAAFTKEEVQNVSWDNYVGSYNTYGLLEYIDPKSITPAQDMVLFLKYLIAYTISEFEQRFTVNTFDTSGRIARKAKVVREWMLAEYGIDVEHIAEGEIERVKN